MQRHPARWSIAPLLLAAQLAAQQTAVSPADRTGLEGSSFTHFPLGRPNARFQFLHADLPPGTVLHGHAYRRDSIQVRGAVDAFAADLQVTLSISPNSPTAASATFASNTGPLATVVLPRTTIQFPATNRPGLDPAPTFELLVPYQVPFVMPPQQATLCVDVVLFGNTSAAGADRNLSLYLDAHEHLGNGTAEQPGYRLASGCAAPGQTAPAYATLSLWHLGASMRFGISARNGVPDGGSGTTRCFLALGHWPVSWPWPGRPECAQLTSTEVWFGLPGTNDPQGSYDGSLAGLPVLPPGYRLWCQTGSIDLQGGGLAFGDLSTLVTPPAAPAVVPAARVAASTDRTATTGAVSLAVPVVQFF